MDFLRLYNSITAEPNYTHDRLQSISINGQEHLVPQRTLIMLNVMAVQTELC